MLNKDAAMFLTRALEKILSEKEIKKMLKPKIDEVTENILRDLTY